MLEQIKIMLQFLDMEKFVIPAFNIPFPKLDLSMIGRYRPDSVWRIHSDGTLSYEGIGYMANDKIWMPQTFREKIVPISSDYAPFIARAYEYLLIDCKKVLSRHIGCTDIPNISTLLRSFHKLDFVTL